MGQEIDNVTFGPEDFEHFEEQLDEIIRVAETCPDRYKVACFEVLASSLTGTLSPPTLGWSDTTIPKSNSPNGAKLTYLAQYNISEYELSRVYHHDGDSYTIIARDLRTKPLSSKQQRLGLLLGVRGLLVGADPIIEKDSLMDLCRRYAAWRAR